MVNCGIDVKSLLFEKSKASLTFVARNVLYFGARSNLDVDQYLSSTLLPYSDQGTPRLQSPSVRSFGINLNLTF